MLQKYTADQFRMFCLLHHYSSSINFSYENLDAAESVISRFREALENIKTAKESNDSPIKWSNTEHELYEE